MFAVLRLSSPTRVDAGSGRSAPTAAAIERTTTRFASWRESHHLRS